MQVRLGGGGQGQGRKLREERGEGRVWERGGEGRWAHYNTTWYSERSCLTLPGSGAAGLAASGTMGLRIGLCV